MSSAGVCSLAILPPLIVMSCPGPMIGIPWKHAGHERHLFCSPPGGQRDDRAVGVVEVDANQAVDQPDEIVAAPKPSKPLGVVAEAQPARCLPDAAVGEGIQLVPGPLGLPKEDVHADVADALALLEQPALHRRITLRGAPEPAEIAAVSVDEKLGGIAQRRGGPLVVAGVAGLVQDAG